MRTQTGSVSWINTKKGYDTCKTQGRVLTAPLCSRNLGKAKLVHQNTILKHKKNGH